MIYIYNNMLEHVYSESRIKAGKVIWYNLVTGAFPLQIVQRTNDVTVTNLQDKHDILVTKDNQKWGIRLCFNF